jgi:hypothetical protein
MLQILGKSAGSRVRCRVVALVMAASCACGVWAQEATVGAQRVADVARGFAHPPDDARVLMRWWWFGPAVVKPELEREILAMKAGGIGGFEIQPVYPMALDDASKNFRNLPYLSNEFLDAVRFASQTARANGMRVDMTLASGWPYGGKYVPVDHAAARLNVVAVDVPVGATSVPVPAMENGERLIAVFAGEGSATQYDPARLKEIAVTQVNGRAEVAASDGVRVMVFYIASRTGQQVKRAAVDADGFVLDHFSRAAVDDHLRVVGDRLMTAFGDAPPYAVFSDSLEVYGADWTDDLLPEFKRRRGYDLTPYLPELASGTDETSAEVRHDWGLTLTELINERYLTPINDWAKAHGTRFRSQTYGEPAVSLSSNNLVDLPEGEGPQWNSFSFTRWATSASHLYGRPVTSGETWTWLHSPAFSATPLDMKAEADRFFLEGVNQIVGHGWPYTPPGVPEPGWAFYAAAVFDDHNPWWIVMPDVTKYLQRVSYVLRQGKPANDVAVLLPEDDVYAEFKPGKVSLSAGMSKYITPALTQAILGAGYNFDYIDSEAIERVGISYPVLVVPHVDRISTKTLQRIAAYEEHGGKVIAVGATPGRAPGFADAAEQTAEVARLSQRLFGPRGGKVVASDKELGEALHSALAPDMADSAGAEDVGFIHRKLADGDLYFVANTSNHSVDATVSFRSTRKFASSWDPLSGGSYVIADGPVKLNLVPYESRIVVFSDERVAEKQQQSGEAGRVVSDLTDDWRVSFPARGDAKAFEETAQKPNSWTENAKTRFFSGVAVYAKTVKLSDRDIKDARRLMLDFGEGTPIAANPDIRSGMRALLDAPIRDVAVVSVNGQRVGSIWHPPYSIDVTGYLHAGENQVEIQVANTAINLLAGRASADYRLLDARYGERFVPQDMKGIKPLPSGILVTVRLMGAK